MKLLLNSFFRLADDHRRQLAAVVPGLEIVETNLPADQLDPTGVEVLVSEQVPRAVETWPQLRWVQLLSAGANQLRNHPIQCTRIPVTTASGTHGVPIAQYVTAMVLMMAHRMPQLLQFKPTRTWPNRVALAGTSLRGLTAGIIGYGSIGRECARQLQALGLRILCQKRDPAHRRDDGYNAWPGTGDPDGILPERWFGPGELGEMLPQCDFIVVAVPSTAETDGMIGDREFALLKPGARLIVVSRGGIVGEAALAEALRSGRLAEAAVDCFVREPLPSDHFLFEVPNLILTPHMSGVYEGFWPRAVDLVAENLRRHSAGLDLLNRVNVKSGY